MPKPLHCMLVYCNVYCILICISTIRAYIGFISICNWTVIVCVEMLSFSVDYLSVLSISSSI